MRLQFFGRLAGVLALSAGLAGCIDVDAEVDVLSESTARTTMTMEITSEASKGLETFIAGMATQMGATPEQMMEAMGGQSLSLEDNCEDGVGSATPDGGSKCVVTTEGTFDELNADGEGPTIEALGGGRVKVTLPIEELKQAGEESGAEQMPDEEIFTQLFENHFITIRVRGHEIVESNMTVAGDKKSAEYKIPSLELMQGKLELDEDLYAIVRVK